MKINNQFITRIPKLPLSALIFYIITLILCKLEYIPNPNEILLFLENLYNSYGLIGLFIASFLEGIAYLGLYFPGSFIIILSVILSDGTLKSFLLISLTVACALTIASLINYFLGRKIRKDNLKKEFSKQNNFNIYKNFLASFIHPNILAFYFLKSGIKKENLTKIILVPFIIIPYGIILSYIFYIMKNPLKKATESPYIIISLIVLWILISFVSKKNK